jgi:hypothetical protein
VGLERTGSTFLQKNVFPALEDITYINKRQYDSASVIIHKAPHATILVSREFNRDFESQIRSFQNQIDAEIRPIIVLRNPLSWLQSQYRQQVKIGCKQSINEFFPLDGSKGELNTDALDFHEKIVLLGQVFCKTPIVWHYEDLVKDPEIFIKNIASTLQVPIHWEKVRLKQIHTSYPDHQLRVLFWSYQHLVSGAFRHKKIYRYVILTIARWLPKRWFRHIELFPEEYLSEFKERFEKAIHSDKHHNS